MFRLVALHRGLKIRPEKIGKISIVLISLVFLFFTCGTANKETNSAVETTWRNFALPYNRVWNAVVRVIMQDMRYQIQAADPDQGYLATKPKEQPEEYGKPKKRISINVNVKKAPDGTLVTAACLIEEFVPVKNTDSGKWQTYPSDLSCEFKLMSAIEKKLSIVK